jgi:anhydro-N-acetylmuramic acid kinase
MAQDTPITAIGLMSGTSMDGIDAAVVRTDGAGIVEPISSLTIPYSPEFRAQLQSILGGEGPVERVGETLTRRHGDAVAALLTAASLSAGDIDVIGFHGHTILHQPENRRTWQIGDGALLASLTGIDVVADFRSADVAAGGEGAPFAPIYHAAVAPSDRPVCVLNVGGVANVTWIGAGASIEDASVFDHLLAFDTGPGNALLDDWVAAHCGEPFDRDGAIAASGSIENGRVKSLMANAYFDRPPPKSLDRDDFSTAALEGALEGLSPADGAATLTAFTVAAVERAGAHLPAPPCRWIVTGGGRHNGFLMRLLGQRLDAPVVSAEQVGLDGDAMEAQAFAYMAVRSLRGLPLSGPSTTGVPRPLSGGRLHRAR